MICSPSPQVSVSTRNQGKSLDKTSIIDVEGLVSTTRKGGDESTINDDALSMRAVISLQKESAVSKFVVSKIDDEEILGRMLRVCHLKPSNTEATANKMLDDSAILENMLPVSRLTHHAATKGAHRKSTEKENRTTVSSLAKNRLIPIAISKGHDHLCVANVEQAMEKKFMAVCNEKIKQEEEYVIAIHEFEMLAAMEEDDSAERIELENLVESLRSENKEAQAQFDSILSHFVPYENALSNEDNCTSMYATMEQFYHESGPHGYTDHKKDELKCTQVSELCVEKQKSSSEYAACSKEVEFTVQEESNIKKLQSVLSIERNKELQSLLTIERMEKLLLEQENMPVIQQSVENLRSLKSYEQMFRDLAGEIHRHALKIQEVEYEQIELQKQYSVASKNIEILREQFEEAVVQKNVEAETFHQKQDKQIAHLNEIISIIWMHLVNKLNDHLSQLQSQEMRLQEKDAHLLELTKQRDHKEAVIRTFEKRRDRGSKERKARAHRQQCQDFKPNMAFFEDALSTKRKDDAAGMDELHSALLRRNDIRPETGQQCSSVKQPHFASRASVHQLRERKIKKEHEVKEAMGQTCFSFIAAMKRLERDKLQKNDSSGQERITVLEKTVTKLRSELQVERDTIADRLCAALTMNRDHNTAKQNNAVLTDTAERFRQEKSEAQERSSKLEKTANNLCFSAVLSNDEIDCCRGAIVKAEKCLAREADLSGQGLVDIEQSLRDLNARSISELEQLDKEKLHSDQTATTKISEFAETTTHLQTTATTLGDEKETLDTNAVVAECPKDRHLGEAKCQIADLELFIKRLKAELAASHQEKNQYQDLISALGIKVTELSSLIVDFEEAKNVNRDSNIDRQDLQSYVDNCTMIEGKVRKLCDINAQLQDVSETKEAEITELREEMLGMSQNVEWLSNERNRLANEAAEMHEMRARAWRESETTIAKLEKELKGYHADNATLLNMNREHFKTISKLNGELLDKHKAFEIATVDAAQRSKEIQELRWTIGNCENDLSTQKRLLDASQAKLNAAELTAKRDISDLRRRYMLMNEVQKRELNTLRKRLCYSNGNQV